MAGEAPAKGNAFIELVGRVSSSKAIEIWPENWTSFQLFQRVSTQWRVGMAGATGLDYTAVYPLLDRLAKTPDEWEQIFDDIQVMESEALSVMAKQNK